ncbi:hypothetical protein D7X87_26740 [bacterium D16-54]|nr:hypothetical protein D7X87_26740 [bacterium D16-54]RKJ08309.1 hypothetical protein D7X65_26735 [bacterium D16-56]
MLMKIKTALIILANTLLSFLPDSPFTAFFDSMDKVPALGYLNYFIPIPLIISIGEAWLTCIGIFYLYQAILRFVKLIE